MQCCLFLNSLFLIGEANKCDTKHGDWLRKSLQLTWGTLFQRIRSWSVVKETFQNPDQESWKLSQQYLFFILQDCVRILTKLLKNLELQRQNLENIAKEVVKILVTVQTKIFTSLLIKILTRPCKVLVRFLSDLKRSYKSLD